MYGMTPVGVFFIAFFPLVIMIRHFVNSPIISQRGLGSKRGLYRCRSGVV